MRDKISSAKKQILKTLSEKKKFKNSPIKYYNFWAIKNAEDIWFSKFIKHRNLNPKNKKINFLSVSGHPKTYLLLSRPIIFFTGEDAESKTFPAYARYRDHLGNAIDLALGFSYREHKNYLRFPLWLLYIIPPDADLEGIKKMIGEINEPDFRLRDKTKFAALISRHDQNGIRKKMIDAVEKIGKVDCAGSFMNNTDELTRVYKDDKKEFLKNYKFNICPENSSTNGYVTEKIFESIVCGCIPLYWGSENKPEPDILNQNAIVFFDENFSHNLKKIAENEDTYRDFASRKPFLDDAPEKIWKMLNDLELRLREVI